MNIIKRIRVKGDAAFIWSAQAVGAVVPTPLAIVSAFVLTLVGQFFLPAVSLLRGMFTIGEYTL